MADDAEGLLDRLNRLTAPPAARAPSLLDRLDRLSAPAPGPTPAEGLRAPVGALLTRDGQADRRARAEALLTEEDRVSPLPNSLIAEGRSILEEADVAGRADAPAVVEPPPPPPAPAPPRGGIPEGATLLGTFADNGRVYRRADGSMGAVSAGGSTTDPATVERIMAGEDFGQIVQQDVDRQRIAETPVAARANELIRGVPFVGSYTDEAVGLVSSQARDNMRASTEAMQRQNPGQTTALNITGALAGAVPMALAAGPSVAAGMPRAPYARALTGAGAGALAGAVEGAVYGSGEGSTLEERSQTAQSGAAWGAAISGPLGAVAPLASAGLRNALQRLRGSDQQAVARELGLRGPAARTVHRALEAGGIDDAMAALDRAGPTAMLADAGLPARQLLDAAVQTGGPAGQIARQAVDARTTAETRAMVTELDRVLGAPRGEREIVDGIRRESQPARTEAYRSAYEAPIDYASDSGREIEALMGRVPASAIRRAEQIMGAEGVESAQRIARIEPLPDGGERVVFETLPDVRTAHLIMQGLDDVVRGGDGQGALGGQTTLGRAYGNLRRDLSEALTAAVPAFGEAQATAMDAIRRREAVEVGYSLLRPATRREDVAEAFAPRGRPRGPEGTSSPAGNPGNLPALRSGSEVAAPSREPLSNIDVARLRNAPAGEREAAREGLRSYIDDTMASVTRTITDPNVETREGIRLLRDMSSRASRTKLRILLGEDDANALLARVDEAATAFELRAAIADNSRTAVRQGIQGAVREEVEGGMMRALMQGEPINAAKRLTMALTGEGPAAQQVREMNIYTEIAQALTETPGPQARRALLEIRRAMNGQVLSEEQAEMVATTLVLPPVIAGERLSLPLRERARP